MPESYPNPNFESGRTEPNKGAGKEGASKKESIPNVPRVERPDTYKPEAKLSMRTPAANELANMAMREQLDSLHRFQEHEDRKKEEKAGIKSSDGSTKKFSENEPQSDTVEQQPAAKTEDTSTETAVSNTPDKLVEAAAGEPLDKAKASTEKLEPASSEHTAKPVDVELPQVAPEAGVEPQQSFEEFVREHEELADLDEKVTTEDEEPSEQGDAFTEAMHRNMSPSFTEAVSGDALTGQKDEFTDFVEGHPELASLERDENQGVGDDSESQPQTSPEDVLENDREDEDVVAGGNMPPRPPLPPTAEGAHDDEDEPEPGSFGSAGIPDPNLLRDPWAPVSDTLSPANIGAMSALEARQRVDSLRHTARERGLAGAVGILGLGLVLEHFMAKRRDKKQQRQINEQGKMIRETNRTLEDERRRHLRSQQESDRRLETLTTNHERVSEQLQERAKAEDRTKRSGLSRAEIAIGGGLIGGAAATELAAKMAGKNSEGRPLTAQELQERAKQDPELARALAVNRANRVAESATTITQSEMMRELSHEHQRDKTSDVGVSKSARSVVAGTDAGSGLPSPQGSMTNVSMPQYAAEVAKATAKHEAISKLGKPWTWAIIGFILLALLAGALAA